MKQTKNTISIDGSQGEGGGQILRTSLSLSIITQTPIHLFNIRVKRSKPGLKNQHLCAVRAAAEICAGQLQGDELNSQELYFSPGEINPGKYHFSIGTAGSTTLVLQTILPPLLHGSSPSQLLIEGGTYNPLCPPFDFLQQCFLPQLKKLGAEVQIECIEPGFYPAGGGKLQVDIQKFIPKEALVLEKRGNLKSITALATLANLPEHIAERELKVVQKSLGLKKKNCAIQKYSQSHSPGNLVSVCVTHTNSSEVLTSLGRKGFPAEKVATEVCKQTKKYLKHNAPVGEYLADQLLLPMAITTGGSYVCYQPSLHVTTNIEIINLFLDSAIQMQQIDEKYHEIKIKGMFT